MFTERQFRILAFLLNLETWISGSSLSDMLNISMRTLQKEIADLNLILKHTASNARITSNNRLGYYLEGNRSVLKQKLSSYNAEQQDDYSSAKSILTVLLFEHDYISIEKIADRVFLAKSSVSANLEKVRRIVESTHEAELMVHPRKGFLLKAPEYIKRILEVRIMDGDITYSAEKIPGLYEAYRMMPDMRELLTDVLLPVDYIVEGNVFEDIVRYCVFSIARSADGFELTEGSEPHELNPVTSEIADKISKRLSYQMSEMEILCLDDRLRELNVIGTTKKDNSESEQIIHDFCVTVTNETGLPFSIEGKHLKRMAEHIQRMNMRITSGNTMVGGYAEGAEKNYPGTLHLIRTCMTQVLQHEIPGAEARLLAPYLAAVFDEMRQKINVYIVSDYPVGLIYRFRMRMRNYFAAHVNEIQIFPVYLYERRFRGLKESDKYAVFLTTETALSFANPELIYIDLYEEEYQFDTILHRIRSMLSLQEKEVMDGIAASFTACEYVCGSVGTDWYGLLEQYGIHPERKNTSLGVIDEKMLLIIEHGRNENCQMNIRLKKPYPYNAHRITQIRYYHINTDLNLLDVFRYIKTH